MPKAYAVVTYRSISDPEKLAAYAKLALPAVTPFGARFLARGNATVAREQGVKERTVVVEYPSLEKATAAYDSAGYALAVLIIYFYPLITAVIVATNGIELNDLSNAQL